MKVLIICSGNSQYADKEFIFSQDRSFVYDQFMALKEANIQVECFFIKGRGIKGYTGSFLRLRKFLRKNSYNVIHAHGGHIGILAVLQFKYPVVITYHGSDVNIPSNNFVSSIANILSSASVFVSKKLSDNIFLKKKKSKTYIIPCGVNFNLFFPFDKKAARKELNLDSGKKYILFSSSFINPVKNYPLASDAVSLLNDSNIELLEFTGYEREKVNLLMNAVDLVLLTSFSEGSPQIIKEAMAVNCPVVTTLVGDVEMILAGTEGCYIAKNNQEDIASKITKALSYNKATNGRLKIEAYDNRKIVARLIRIFERVKH